MEICPALLTNDLEEFVQQFNRLKNYFHHFQIDREDGTFVEPHTLTIDQIIALIKNKKIDVSGILFDFDLMVQDYEKELNDILVLSKYCTIGIVLIQSSLNPDLEKLQKQYPFPLGFILLPSDTLEKVPDLLFKCARGIQILSVTPGKQGQAMQEQTLNKIEQLREQNYRNKIYLDGGINDKTLPTILSKEYKPDVFCIGSYLTKAENLEERIQYLRTLKFNV